ncbi:hypothetical protein [Erwinia sp. JH02]|uniref:gp53-like domain-containing protein n=1 Tax=Erwinia sp. JH02 TaxID=2733394 RepID=UPI001F11D139|nr:hypothetical protein [Erwinia sp. JH02]
MNRTDEPKKQAVPFAVNGQREELLPTSPAGDNTASYDAGFPAVTMILKAAGGLPPKGQDMNQILFELASIARWASAGAGYAYDAAFSTTVGGYPVGAKVLSTDGAGYWINTSEANSTNPEVTNGSLTGWVPSAFYGVTAITGLAAANVTLTSLQAARDRIELSGALTANINIIVPAWRKAWTVVNNCTGSFAITVKTPSGAGVSIATGKRATVYGDATNITDQGYLLASNNLSEIAAAGPVAVAATLANLGLGEAAKRAVGTGTNQIPDMTYFSQSLTATSGVKNIPGGFKIQFGSFSLGSAASSTQTVTFTEAFPTTCIALVPTPTGASDQQIGFSSLTATTGVIRKGNTDTASRTGTYVALGY